MVNFENTAVAFRAKSDSELNRCYWLFRLMGLESLAAWGMKALLWALKLRLPVEWLVKRTLFAQFCGGETIAECRATIEALAKFRIGTILDYSVEGNHSEAAFDATTAELRRSVELARGNPDVPFCVFKITALARFALLEKLGAGLPLTPEETAEWRRVEERVESLAALAHRSRVRLLIDAEESWIQAPIDALTLALMARYNRETPLIYDTVQMYLADRLSFLERAVARAESEGFYFGVKLVRGAYLEKERDRAQALGYRNPLCPDKAATDRHFDAALGFLAERFPRIALCAGTHNEASTQRLTRLMQQHGLANDDTRVFFAQLYGMGDHLSYNLADAGYHVAKYVPYGPVRSVIPYLIRRAEENSSIEGQSSRELAMLERERARRARPGDTLTGFVAEAR